MILVLKLIFFAVFVAVLFGAFLFATRRLAVFLDAHLPTSRARAKQMIELAQIKPGQIVIDLGSGDGRLLFLAAKKGAQAIGYELNLLLVCFVRVKAWVLGVSQKVQVRRRSVLGADLSNVNVVFLFLFPEIMPKLEKKLFSELRPGTKIISNTYTFKNRKPTLRKGDIFLYIKK